MCSVCKLVLTRSSLLLPTDCHCHATPEPVDPDFVFRDFLLEKLICLEARVPAGEELRFQYHTIKEDAEVQSALTRTALIAVDTAGKPSLVSKERLYRGTFQCLRDDGILFLIHRPSDTYVLNSYSRVLSRDCRRRPLPDHLSKVPKVRLDLVRRMIAQVERKDPAGQKASFANIDSECDVP
jgi:hypothetical protein